jgi:hypothetical protein
MSKQHRRKKKSHSVAQRGQRRHPPRAPVTSQANDAKSSTRQNKQSKLPTRKKKPREGDRFPPAEPMELAKLAAILQPGAKNRADALKAAMEWYFDAVLVAREQTNLEQALLKRSRRRLLHLIALRYLRGVPAQAWADTADLDEARRLLDDPRQLAEKLDKLPKEGEPRPPSGERLLHELPGIPFEKPAWSSTSVMKNVLLGMEYMLCTVGVVRDADNTRRLVKEMFANGKIPTFLLEWVLRARYERRKEIDRKSWHANKPRRKNLKKSDKKNLKKSSVE